MVLGSVVPEVGTPLVPQTPNRMGRGGTKYSQSGERG